MNYDIAISDGNDMPFSQMALVNLHKLEAKRERIKSKIKSGDKDPELLRELQDIQKEMEKIQNLAANF